MTVDISDLTPEQRDLLIQGCSVLWPGERRRIEIALARHLREGTSKSARSIPTEGVKGETLALAGGLWMLRGALVAICGLVLIATVHTTSPLRLVGYGILGVGCIGGLLFCIRLAMALLAKKRFQRERASGSM